MKNHLLDLDPDYIARIVVSLDTWIENLKSNPDPDQVATMAQRQARHIEGNSGAFQLLSLAESIPRPSDASTGKSAARTREMTSGVEIFVRRLREVVEEMQEFADRQKTNANVPAGEIRNRVLRQILITDAKVEGNYQPMSDVQFKLGLSQMQIRDAVEFWHKRGALESLFPMERYMAGNVAWRFRLTPDGRDIANGVFSRTTTSRPSTGDTIVQGDMNIHNHGHGNINQVGAHNTASTSIQYEQAARAFTDELRAGVAAASEADAAVLDSTADIVDAAAEMKNPNLLRTVLERAKVTLPKLTSWALSETANHLLARALDALDVATL